MKRLVVALSSVGLSIALLLSGCAGLADPVVDDTAELGSIDDGIQIVDPVELVGVWRVTDAAGEGDHTWLRLADDMMIWNDCGVASGTWAARDDAFIASIDGGQMGDCAFGDEFPADWVTGAAGYGNVDGELVLLDADHKKLATLTIDGAPPTSENYLDEYTEQPDLDEVSDYLDRDIADLPADAVPVDSLVGTWAPAGFTGTAKTFVEFTEAGDWFGSDGCNGIDGRWAAGENGTLLTTAGPSTAIGCEGSAAPYWVVQASTVGMVGDELTLYDADGAVLGALVAA